jgi:O-antigen/teichoic acid export membrane protein
MRPADSHTEEQAGGRPAPQAAYGGQLLRGSIWMIGLRWVMRFIGLASTMILARLLAPDDFGLIAMVMLAYGLLETISYAGVDLALMRPGAATREHQDTAWTVQILQGLFIATCLLLAAPWVAEHFKEPRATAVMAWVALRAVIESFQNIGVVAFRRELDFAREFRFSLYGKLINFVVVVAAAWVLRNYWALVIGSIVASVLGVALSYMMHPYRPRLSLARIGEIWGFSQWLVISRLGTYLNRKCDEFVVGMQGGAASMGSYHVANELATLPSNEIVAPVRRAMFPALAKIADQREQFTAAVLSSFSAVAALCLFIGFSLMVTAPELVRVVLGAPWASAEPLMRWMAVFGAFSALVMVLEVPLWVAGQTRISAVQSWLELAVIAPATWWAVTRYGAEGAAAARAAVSVAMVPIMMGLTARVRQVSFGQLAGALWRPVLAALLMAAAVHSLPWPADAPALLMLALKGLCCVALYPLLLLGLWGLSGRPPGAEAALVKQLRQRVARGSGVGRPG